MSSPLHRGRDPGYSLCVCTGVSDMAERLSPAWIVSVFLIRVRVHQTYALPQPNTSTYRPFSCPGNFNEIKLEVLLLPSEYV